MITHKQLSLADIFENCQNIFEEDKPQFLTLLEQHIDLSEYIPVTFYNHFYASTEHTRTYPLTAFLWAFNNPKNIYHSNRPVIAYISAVFQTPS